MLMFCMNTVGSVFCVLASNKWNEGVGEYVVRGGCDRRKTCLFYEAERCAEKYVRCILKYV